MDWIFILLILVIVFFLLWFFTFIFLILVMKFTPAMTWFKAWFLRRPVLALHYKDGLSRFVCGGKRMGNFTKVKGLGQYELCKGTSNFDIKTKMPWYNIIAEQVKTLDVWMPAIITELKEMGYQVEKWKDLDSLINAATDKSWCVREYKRLKKVSKDAAERFILMVKNIRRNAIKVYLNRAYKFNELYNIFPNDYNPACVDEAVQLGIAADRRKREHNIFAIAMAIFIIVLVFVIAYLAITKGGNQAVTVKVTGEMLKNSTNLLVG